MLSCRRLQNQLEVFVHQLQWKLRTVIVDRYPRQLSHMGRSDHGSLRQDFEQPLAIETRFLPKDQASAIACMPTPNSVLTTNFIAVPEPEPPRRKYCFATAWNIGLAARNNSGLPPINS